MNSRQMLIGASLGSFLGLEFNEALEVFTHLAHEMGLQAAEIRLEREPGRPSLWPWEVKGAAEQKLADFLSMFKVKGVHLPFIYLNPICPNEGIARESIAEIKAGIDVAARLGMDYALTHIYGVAYGVSRSEQLARWSEIIEGLTAHARERSVRLTLENGALLANLKELADMVRSIDSPALRMTLDTGHAYSPVTGTDHHTGGGIFSRVLAPFRSVGTGMMPFAEYGSLANFVKQEQEIIYNLHVHDNDGSRDHLLVGDGQIDFSFLDIVRDRPLIVEALFNDANRDMRVCYERISGILSPV